MAKLVKRTVTEEYRDDKDEEVEGLDGHDEDADEELDDGDEPDTSRHPQRRRR